MALTLEALTKSTARLTMDIDNSNSPEFIKWFEENVSATMGSDSIQWRYARMGWNAHKAAPPVPEKDPFDEG